MQTGLHAASWAAQRLGILVGAVVLGAILCYVLLVFAIVVIQGVGALGGQ